jgi:hypothetical protein
VHRGPGGALRNSDLGEGRIIRRKESFPLPVHANAPGNEVRLNREDITIALDACDLAALHQLPEHVLQVLLALGWQAEQPEQFRYVRRDICFMPQQSQELFFHQRNDGSNTWGTATLDLQAD